MTKTPKQESSQNSPENLLVQLIDEIHAEDERKVERIRDLLSENPNLKMYKFERIKDGYNKDKTQ